MLRHSKGHSGPSPSDVSDEAGTQCGSLQAGFPPLLTVRIDPSEPYYAWLNLDWEPFRPLCRRGALLALLLHPLAI